MFAVGHVLISDEVATAHFACDLPVCKGACCVIGDAGAPVSPQEVPVLAKAFEQLNSMLRPEVRREIRAQELVIPSRTGLELRCSDDGACLFVVFEGNVAHCAIQKAFLAGEFTWEKPISCHLFPIRINRQGTTDLMNFQYVPSICKPGRVHGEQQGLYLAECLERPLVRLYGRVWFQSFLTSCNRIRSLSSAS